MQLTTAEARAGAPARLVGLTTTSWRPQGELDLRDWAAQGHRLGVIGRAAGWWVADWLCYGNERFGDRYARAARITGYDVQTLMNMVCVASSIEPSRRRENLSFSHHAEVAALPPDEQDRWLDRAIRDRLSVRCLREEIRRERRSRRGLPAGPGSRPRAEHAVGAGSDLVCPACGCRMAAGDERGRATPA
jgi:hypothetical protein